MIFRRTSSGLSNQHLFLNVDTVVFVEGGKSYSKDEVYSDQFDAHSIDTKFWQGLFSIYCNSESLQFRAIGSKSTIKSIIQDIESGKIKNVYVAMDRDFDSINGRLVHVKGVIYTYGYSWENDVWHPAVVQDVFQTFYTSPDSTQNRILALCNKFVKDIRIAVCADALLSKNGATFIPRNKHMCCLKMERNNEPVVNVVRLEELLAKVNLSKKEVQDFGVRFKINSLRDCYGHLLSDFCYFLISHFLKKVAKLPSIAKHYVISIGIEKFLVRLKNKQLTRIDRHYKLCFTSLT